MLPKFKAKRKDGRLIVKVDLSRSESVNEADLESFSRIYIRGFLKPRKSKKNQIEYTGPMGISLYERMKFPVTKYEFFFIVEQIVDSYQKLQQHNLLPGRVVWDIHQVYFNESTKELQFLYLPLLSAQTGGDIRTLIDSVGYSAIPRQESNTDYISRFMFFFNSLSTFRVEEIEKFIEREDRKAVYTIKKYGVKHSGFMTDKPKDYYEHYGERRIEGENNSELTNKLVEEAETGLLDEKTGLLGEDEETGLLNDEGTAVLNENQTNIHYPSLLRVLTSETVSINKPVFRLGKERSYVDYFVTNNNAVSRSHADIITRSKRYFVMDLDSKNRTYINDRIIPVQQEVEIFDGDHLKLANEEFIFYI